MDEEKVKKTVNKLLGLKEYHVVGSWERECRAMNITAKNKDEAADIFRAVNPEPLITISVANDEEGLWYFY